MQSKILHLCIFFISSITWLENKAMQCDITRSEYRAFIESIRKNRHLYQDTLDALNKNEDPYIKTVLIQDLIETYKLSQLNCTQEQIQYLIANYQN